MATAFTTRSTSSSVVFQLTTLTRIARELRGTVVDGRGKPVTRGRVALVIQEEGQRTYLRDELDASGRFGFAGLGAGRFTLYAEGEGHLRTDPIEVEVANNQTVVEKQIVLETAYPRVNAPDDGADHRRFREEEAALLIESSVDLAAPIALHAASGDNHVKVRFDEVRR